MRLPAMRDLFREKAHSQAEGFAEMARWCFTGHTVVQNCNGGERRVQAHVKLPTGLAPQCRDSRSHVR